MASKKRKQNVPKTCLKLASFWGRRNELLHESSCSASARSFFSSSSPICSWQNDAVLKASGLEFDIELRRVFNEEWKWKIVPWEKNEKLFHFFCSLFASSIFFLGLLLSHFWILFRLFCYAIGSNLVCGLLNSHTLWHFDKKVASVNLVYYPDCPVCSIPIH